METARLLLRPVEERDAPELAQLYRDPGIARWCGVLSDEQVAEWAHLTSARSAPGLAAVP